MTLGVAVAAEDALCSVSVDDLDGVIGEEDLVSSVAEGGDRDEGCGQGGDDVSFACCGA